MITRVWYRAQPARSRWGMGRRWDGGYCWGVNALRSNRTYGEQLDVADPLAKFRDRFLRADDAPIYLDGNSLGPLPLATQARIAEVVGSDWGTGLVRSWGHWVGLPRDVGDLIGEHLTGAGPGQILVGDSTTVNLFKLVNAALDAQPARNVLVTDDDNFPTDRYVLQGVAAQRRCELRMLHTDLDQGVAEDALLDALGPDVALVSLSHVAYRSGALADMPRITGQVHEAGALMAWDLCHSVGAVPIKLDASAADLAVGCTYKYLNAGPGAPAFLYVRRELQEQMRQPIWGWFGQSDQFAMGPGQSSPGSPTSGTPSTACARSPRISPTKTCPLPLPGSPNPALPRLMITKCWLLEAPKARDHPRVRLYYSHSMVPGGLLVMSSTTRLIC